jgi:hypothetical protein
LPRLETAATAAKRFRRENECESRSRFSSLPIKCAAFVALASSSGFLARQIHTATLPRCHQKKLKVGSVEAHTKKEKKKKSALKTSV